MKKIAVITGTRAEYGLLKPLIDKLNNDKEIELQLIVAAMHLSSEFGYTINEIIADGYPISIKVDCLLNSDTSVGVSKSIGLALMSFAEGFEELSPDTVVVLGDRTEVLACVIAANMANIPVAHIHGGETTEGAYDEGIRHAITKMSYWHFTSTEAYRNRVIQLGESPERVYNVGAIGLDSIKGLDFLSKEDFENSIDFQLGSKTALLTFHPVTLEKDTAKIQFENILSALSGFKDLKVIFTHANSDKGGKVINEMIKEVCADNDNYVEFKSLGQLRYLSALQHVDLVIGNSSSGIIEVPYYYIPTVNIGDRQKGRVAPKSVMHVSEEKESVKDAINNALDNDFLKEIKGQDQLYGNGNTVSQILTILKTDSGINLKKSFYDLNLDNEY